MRSILIIFLSIFPFINVFADSEPNDTWQEANVLAKDTTVAGTQSENDWYRIDVVDGSRILIDLTFDQTLDAENNIVGDLMLRLRNDSLSSDPDAPFPGTTEAVGSTQTDHEFIDVPGLAPGTYYIQVDGDNAGTAYTLTWTEITGTDDGFESNNTSASAKALAAGEVAFGLQSDEDVFSIDVTAGNERVLASLRFSGTQLVDLDLTLRDSDGNVIVASVSGASVNEAIDIDLTSTSRGAGTYYLWVTGDNDADGYALNWAGVSPTGPGGFPVPDETPTTTTTATTTSSDSGAFSPLWLIALALAGLLRRKYR